MLSGESVSLLLSIHVLLARPAFADATCEQPIADATRHASHGVYIKIVESKISSDSVNKVQYFFY